MSIVVAFDAIHANVPRLPAKQLAAGYTTGSADIRWTAADWAAHPHAVRIDQDAAASDGTADVLDVEAGAATFADCPSWAKRAMSNFQVATRPGQREPAVYMSASNVSSVVNALIGGGVKSGVGLFIANWNLSEPQAVAEVLAASGPFPIIGIQYASGSFYDFDVFSAQWLDNVSGATPPPPPPPPGKAVQPTSVHATARWTNATITWSGAQHVSSYWLNIIDTVTGFNTQIPLASTAGSGSYTFRKLKMNRTYKLGVYARPGVLGSHSQWVTVTTR